VAKITIEQRGSRYYARFTFSYEVKDDQA